MYLKILTSFFYCFCLCLFIAIGLHSYSTNAAGIRGSVNLEATAWISNCQGAHASDPLNCQPPQPIGHPSNFTLVLAETNNPGQAGRVAKDFLFNTFSGQITLYSVYPALSAGIPPYIQIRVELTSPVRAVCLQSVEWKENNFLAPPTTCAGFDPTSKKQWGLNLKIQ